MRSSQYYCIEGELQDIECGEEYGRGYCDITVDGQRIHMARNARWDKWGVREGDWCLVTVNDRGDGCLVGISILMIHCSRDGRYFSQVVRESMKTVMDNAKIPEGLQQKILEIEGLKCEENASEDKA